MSSDTRRITVRIPEKMVEELECIVDKSDYANMSEAIRAALESFIDTMNAPEYISQITVKLPKKKVDEIQSLVTEGDSISVDDAIRNAVREYVRGRIKEYRNELTDEC